MNSETISQTYNRKSPIFLAEIVTFISTLVVRTYPSQNQTFNTFTLVVLIISASELLIKGIILWKANRCCNLQNSRIEQYISVIFGIAHIALLVYGSVLLFNPQYRQKYQRFEPQFFYLKVYVMVYASIIIALALLFLIGTVLVSCMFKMK